MIEAVGRLEDHYKLYLAMSDTRLTDLDQIRNTVIRSGPERCGSTEGYRDGQ